MEQRGKLSWRADDAGLQLKEYVSVTLIRLRDFTHRTQINWLETGLWCRRSRLEGLAGDHVVEEDDDVV